MPRVMYFCRVKKTAMGGRMAMVIAAMMSFWAKTALLKTLL